MKNNLEILKRKQKAKVFCIDYQSLFSSFKSSKELNLLEMDFLLESLKHNLSKKITIVNEIIKEIPPYNSRLINPNELTDEKVYVFANDYENCGMYLIDTKEILSRVFDIVKEDAVNGTIFIVNTKLNESIRINYYDHTHNDLPLTYEIEKRVVVN